MSDLKSFNHFLWEFSRSDFLVNENLFELSNDSRMQYDWWFFESKRLHSTFFP